MEPKERFPPVSFLRKAEGESIIFLLIMPCLLYYKGMVRVHPLEFMNLLQKKGSCLTNKKEHKKHDGSVWSGG